MSAMTPKCHQLQDAAMSPDLVENRRPAAPQNPYRSENDDERRGIDHSPNFRANTNLTHSPVRLRPPDATNAVTPPCDSVTSPDRVYYLSLNRNRSGTEDPRIRLNTLLDLTILLIPSPYLLSKPPPPPTSPTQPTSLRVTISSSGCSHDLSCMANDPNQTIHASSSTLYPR